MTRFDSPADLRDDIPRLDKASRSWVTAILLGVAVVIVGFAWVFTFVIALGTALAFIYGGFVYGVIGTLLITIRWIIVPREGSTGPADRVRVTEVHQFATGAQRNTLILNIVLLLNLGAFFLTPASPDDSLRGDGVL